MCSFQENSRVKNLLLFLFIVCDMHVLAQQSGDTLWSFTMGADATITIDAPARPQSKNLLLICFALPNGNTTAETMGKKLLPGDDWHFDIQHIRAQTAFIRGVLQNTTVVVAYFENTYKSWPAWKTYHEDYAARVKQMVDTVYGLLPAKNKAVYLNGHSGGGRFIFSYLDAVPVVPAYVERISFLDSDYGYDADYFPKLNTWLQASKKHALNVFAYNDSVALYDGKPVVSATGGTWYRSHCLLNDLSAAGHAMTKLQDDSLIVYASQNKRIQFFFKTNPERKIYHTVQVERNGFIHSILCGTKYDSKGYTYFGPRAYQTLISAD